MSQHARSTMLWFGSIAHFTGCLDSQKSLLAAAHGELPETIFPEQPLLINRISLQSARGDVFQQENDAIQFAGIELEARGRNLPFFVAFAVKFSLISLAKVALIPNQPETIVASADIDNGGVTLCK